MFLRRGTFQLTACAFLASAALTATLSVYGVARASGYRISVVAGLTGNVTTLQCYDPEPNRAHPSFYNKPDPFAPCRLVDDNLDHVTGTHAGSRPVDIAALGSVYLQLDYLPGRDRGGYAYAEDVSGMCSAYVGKTLRVWTYHFDPTDSYDVHDVYFEHINLAVPVQTWMYWNNPFALTPLWQPWLVNFNLNNTTSGGWNVGSVAQPASGTPAGCATGAHLHQDTGVSHGETWATQHYAEGCFNDGGAYGGARCPTNPSTWAWITGQPVTGRYSDVQYLTININ